MTQHWHIVTIFPGFFTSPLSCGLMGKAIENGIITVTQINPRDFSNNPHNSVDDRPYGGGAGMVMRAGPLANALRSIAKPGKIILLTPRGETFDESHARRLADENDITLICGRYEGIDERLSDIFPIEPLCTGPYILNGGETAALAVLEATARLRGGFMGKMESAHSESFSYGLLEHPHYTRPEIFEECAVPPVLLGGNHALIARWRREKSLVSTLRYNPCLMDNATLNQEDINFLKSLPRDCAARNFSFCLLHNPVVLEKAKIGTSSLTNLDVHDIARISYSYGLAPFYIVTPLEDQFALLQKIILHWTEGAGGRTNTDRKKALERVKPMPTFSSVIRDIESHMGLKPYIAASSASLPKDAPLMVSACKIREILRNNPVILCLGTARGLAPEFIENCDGILKPIRFLSENHLSVRSAAAIIADRIFGDYY